MHLIILSQIISNDKEPKEGYGGETGLLIFSDIIERNYSEKYSDVRNSRAMALIYN